VDDARRMNLKLLPPDVNRSDAEFSVVSDNELTFGLSAIKGLGEPVVKGMMAERTANGPFKNIFDFAERLDPKVLGKGALEILIKAGALDSFKATRSQHLAVVERAIQGAASKHRDRLSGQKSLFGDDDAKPVKAGEKPAVLVLPEVPEFGHSQILAFEKEVIGFYLTSHPLTEHATKLSSYATHQNKDLATLDDKAEVMVGGTIGSIKRAVTKKPSKNGHSKYANFDLEDVTGIVRCIIWPEDFNRQSELVKSDEIVFVRGRVDRRGREPNLIVQEIITLEAADKKFTEKVIIRFQRGLHTEGDFVQARNILLNYPGKCDVMLIVESYDDANPEKKIKFPISSDLRVSADAQMERDLQGLLGKQNVRFHGEPKKKVSRQMAYSGE
jgi:DNA polymerase-3 subunit alpha